MLNLEVEEVTVHLEPYKEDSLRVLHLHQDIMVDSPRLVHLRILMVSQMMGLQELNHRHLYRISTIMIPTL